MYVHIQSFELFLHFHHIKWNYFQQSSFHNETLFLLLNGVETRKKRPKLLVINSSLLLCIAPQPTLTPILFSRNWYSLKDLTDTENVPATTQIPTISPEIGDIVPTDHRTSGLMLHTKGFRK